MLVLKKARLVFLANPKTATQSLRAMLAPHAKATPADTGDKHINASQFAEFSECVKIAFHPHTLH